MSNKAITTFLEKLSSLAGNFEITDEMITLTNSFLKKEKDEKKTSPKKDSPKKDPNAPKKPTNAYMIYAKEKRAEIAEETGLTDAKELVREIGRRWTEEKTKNSKLFNDFTQKLVEAKETYEEEMKSYVAPEESESPKKKSSKKDSPKKDPNAPKKPTNAYMIYAKEKRAEIAEETGLTDAKELVREIGRRWTEEKTKNSKIFKEFTQKLEEAKETYEEELKTYEAKSKWILDDDEVPPPKTEKKSEKKKTVVEEESDDVPPPKKAEKKSEKKTVVEESDDVPPPKKAEKKKTVVEESDDVPPPPKIEKKKKSTKA
jgi:HMG (high mobility group) box